MRELRERLAAAPISWGVCEVPGWGRMLPPERVLAEMQQLGFRATEHGPVGYLPDDPAEARELLARFDLRLIGGFLPVVLHDPAEARATEELAVATAQRFQQLGAELLVAAVVVDQAWSPRVPLDADAWKHVFSMFDRLDQIAAANDLDHVVHPHIGTLIESAEDVRRVLDNSPVHWCLDTGHLMLGGTDPVAFAAEAFDRVRHVHLKDVRPDVAEPLQSGELTLTTATQRGLFCPLGRGAVPVAETVVALERSGYNRWYVLEQDTALTAEPPQGSGPVVDVAASVDYLITVVAAQPGTLIFQDARRSNPGGTMHIRRIRLIGLTLAVGLVAAACGDDDESSSDTTAGAVTTAAAEAPAPEGQGADVSIAVVTHGDGGSFWAVAKKGAEDAASDLGITVNYQESNNDPQLQAQLIDTAVSSGVNGLVVSMPNPDALRDSIAKAVEAGIPVITMNSGVDQYKEFGAITHVGQTETVAGQGAGEKFKELGATKLLCVIHEQANIGLEQRCEGLVEGFGGDVENLQVTGTADVSATLNEIQSKLTADGDIDGVLALNPDIALGRQGRHRRCRLVGPVGHLRPVR